MSLPLNEPGWLWVPVVLFAAAAQTVRNTAQRSLTTELGTLPATLVRFLYGLPFALVYLALLSSAAFSLWSLLLKHNRVSQVTVFNFSVPVFGAVLSAIFLGEALLEWKNLLALVLVCGGIWLVTRDAASFTK